MKNGMTECNGRGCFWWDKGREQVRREDTVRTRKVEYSGWDGELD